MDANRGDESVLAVVAEHVATYHGGAVRVEKVKGKGRVLVADADFDAGERIMLEYPLIQAVADESIPVYKLVRKLKEDGVVELAPIFYLAALCSLTPAEAAGATCSPWQGVPAQTQAQALELHAPEESLQEASESIQRLVAEIWPQGSGPDPLLLERLLQVWIYNSFDLAEGDGTEAGVVFLAAAMMSHSCAPSAAWHLDDANSFILHARRAVEEGEEVTISYLGPADLCLPTGDRQELLYSTKGFLCSCSRCTASRDSARAFRCPRCGGGEALARAQPWQPDEDRGDDVPASCSSTASPRDGDVACSSCGDLSAAEATPLLAAEARLRPWARSRPEFQTLGQAQPEAEVEASVASELLLGAQEAGLADRHWIVDALREAAAVEQPTRAAEILRQRIAVHEEGSGYCITKRARLQIALAEALCAHGALEDLREAAAAYADAAVALGVLFGDDHPEHLAAARSQEMTKKKLASLSSASARGPAPRTDEGRPRAGQKGKKRR